ncbi:MAG: type II toxin-antitoxin system VapC family toxin [Lentisphaerota bacterium]
MYLLDTDIIIYSLKGDRNVIENLLAFREQPKTISVITYGELIFGAQKSKHKISNLAKIHNLKETFPIIDITPSIMDTFGALKADLQKSGNTIDDFDLLIASTSITHGYTLVTNNEQHFKRIP